MLKRVSTNIEQEERNRVDNKPNIENNDVVVIADSRENRNNWSVGKIKFIYPVRDGLVRVVDVRTSKGIDRLPDVKICKLDINRKYVVVELH